MSIPSFTFEGRPIYLPPDDIECKIIIDLGCFTGITTAAYSSKYPDAEVFGYEIDTDNYNTAMARSYSGLVRVFNKAVWTHEGTVEYNLWGPETHHIVGVHSNAGNVARRSVECTTLDQITFQYDAIDFIKFDIEGAEHSILALGGDWVEKTRSIFLEIHDYTNDNIRAALQRLGFEIVNEGFELIWGVRP